MLWIRRSQTEWKKKVTDQCQPWDDKDVRVDKDFKAVVVNIFHQAFMHMFNIWNTKSWSKAIENRKEEGPNGHFRTKNIIAEEKKIKQYDFQKQNTRTAKRITED